MLRKTLDDRALLLGLLRMPSATISLPVIAHSDVLRVQATATIYLSNALSQYSCNHTTDDAVDEIKQCRIDSAKMKRNAGSTRILVDTHFQKGENFMIKPEKQTMQKNKRFTTQLFSALSRNRVPLLPSPV